MPVKSNFTAHIFILTAILGLVSLIGCSKSSKHSSISFIGEVKKLSDTATLAQSPGGTAQLLSTYDRTGGNRDWTEYKSLRVENGYKIIATLQGPGCIHRIWMTGQAPKNWVIFIDGETTPRIMGLQERSEIDVTNQTLPFQEPLTGRHSGGWICHAPIPFAKSLKIGVPEDYSPRSPYYQINYTRYPKGTDVTPYPKKFSPDEITAIQTWAKAWSSLDEELSVAAKACNSPTKHELAAGQSIQWFEAKGPGVLETFSIKVQWNDAISQAKQDDALRSLRLTMHWDAAEKPSVDVPLGDFFGNAFHKRPYSSLMMGLVNNTYICRLPMPFAKGAKATITNEGKYPVSITSRTSLAKKTIKPLRYFHAVWNKTSSMDQPSGRPHVLMDARGTGHLIGSYVNTISGEPSWNILEGDDQYFIDGSLSPSLQGTGLEDQFNGAWYYSDLSDEALSGLLGKAAMNCDQYRWMHGERVPFSTRLRNTLEFGHVMASAQGPNTSKGEITSTTYYYLDTPSGVTLPEAAKRKRPTSPIDSPTILAGLMQLEHEGLWETARNRCLALAERETTQQLKQVLQIRAENTLEYLGRKNEALASYSKFDTPSLAPNIKAQLDTLLAFHSNTNNILLWTHTSCTADLYFNGELAYKTTSPLNLYSTSKTLKPTNNEITAQLQFKQDPWISIVVKAHGWETALDNTWEFTQEKPSDWPNTSDPKITWEKVPKSHYLRPRMSTWNMSPNIFAGAQKDFIIMISNRLDKKEKGKAVYLRRRLPTK